MKALTSIKQVKFLAYVVVIVWTTQGCEKEEEVPDYVGTWVTAQTQNSTTGGIVTLRDILDFSEKSFTNLGQVMHPQTNEWLDFIGVKGKITIQDNTMNVVVFEMGMSKFDLFSGMPTGKIYYYRDGQTEFNSMLKSSQMTKCYQSKFQVSGNKLTLWTDKNNDGDYADENEESIFIRQ
jgi:hypothetical protein